MKFIAIFLLLINTVFCQIVPGETYTITNAQFTGSMLSVSTQSQTNSRVESSTQQTNGFFPLHNWVIRPLGSNQWSLQSSGNNLYLGLRGGAVAASQTPLPWEIRVLPGNLFVILTTDGDGSALSLQTPNDRGQILLLPATGAVTQNWIFKLA